MEIPLTKGYVTVIDDEDYPLVAGRSWCAIVIDGQVYAYSAGGYMHRLLTGAAQNQLVDHKDGDGLNNRRSNLRLATKSQNSMNRRPNRSGTSGYKGVSFHRKARKWVACLKFQGRYHHLGLFASEEDAARAYDRKATELFGEFARLNFPRTGEPHGRSSIQESPTNSPGDGKSGDRRPTLGPPGAGH